MSDRSRTPDALSGVEARYPGLVDRVRRLIEESERAFSGRPSRDGGASFLWEHTVHVASLAGRIARAGKRDPVPAVLTALFHDAGKFRGGRLHAGDEPEEEASAAAARAILPGAGAPSGLVEDIVAGLKALYNEMGPAHPLAAVVHDADFLAKSGTLGVAQFFVKSALRGRTLRDTVLNTLSKELTYAAVLPSNMRTAAGRVLARAKSRDSLRFFDHFLGELNEAWPPGFRVTTIKVRGTHDFIRQELGRVSPEFIKIRLVVPAACDRCGGRWRYEPSIVSGVKCRELRVVVRCGRCDSRSEIAFCLPEL
jgi:HD superfamily phosphodiesterase